jgi:predicted metal-binding protein
MVDVNLKDVLSTPRKITPTITESQLKADLDRYVKVAKDFGASDAKIILAEDVVVDERVRMKCLIPLCHRYGNSGFCPPNAPEPELIRKMIKMYKYAILVKHDVLPKEDFTSPGKREVFIERTGKHHRKILEIVSKLEVVAFNDGHYLAMGLVGGSCRTVLCKGAPCPLLHGGECKFPLIARPSMEGVGIDVYNLVAKAGWDIYPIGPKDVDPAKVPCAVSAGIVFIH